MVNHYSCSKCGRYYRLGECGLEGTTKYFKAEPERFKAEPERFKAEPERFKAEDGRYYETREEAVKASMLWNLMGVLMLEYRYRYQRDAQAHAKQLIELEEKATIIIDWDLVVEKINAQSKVKVEES